MAMTERTVLITGSTDGVGRRVAERLARPGTTLLIQGRDKARAEAAATAVEKAGGTARIYIADLSSLAAVRGLAEAVSQDHQRLDVLINNAGIGTGGDGSARQTSPDGHELRFAVNYLAGFLLTRMLLPLLPRGARIVNVSSAGQQAIDFSDVMLERGYDGWRAYRQSKLAQVLFTLDLAEELRETGVTVNCLHPATFMDTTMVRASGATPLNSVDTGADAILQLAQSPALEGKTGRYYNVLNPARADAQAYDAEARGRLRELSFALTGAPK
jgi:NAD(P)-dependent dehydrogenase (short-subunit alcohol dehydrogenase family)